MFKLTAQLCASLVQPIVATPAVKLAISRVIVLPPTQPAQLVLRQRVEAEVATEVVSAVDTAVSSAQPLATNAVDQTIMHAIAKHKP